MFCFARAEVLAGAAVVLLSPAAGAADASAAPALTWSREGNTITSEGFGNSVGPGVGRGVLVGRSCHRPQTRKGRP